MLLRLVHLHISMRSSLYSLSTSYTTHLKFKLSWLNRFFNYKLSLLFYFARDILLICNDYARLFTMMINSKIILILKERWWIRWLVLNRTNLKICHSGWSLVYIYWVWSTSSITMSSRFLIYVFISIHSSTSWDFHFWRAMLKRLILLLLICIIALLRN